MRMPVQLPDGHNFRLDMSHVVNAVEAMILSAPPRVLTRLLQEAVPGNSSATDGAGRKPVTNRRMSM